MCPAWPALPFFPRSTWPSTQRPTPIPVLQVTADPAVGARYGDDLDVVLGADADGWAEALLRAILGVAGREFAPKLNVRGNTDFQFTRGLLGVSM